MTSKTAFPDQARIDALIAKSRVCRLGVAENGSPYVVPLSFGYQDNVLYFHSAPKGRKIEILKKNPRVCFEFDTLTRVIEHDMPCSWDMEYQSVIGCGRAEFIEDAAEKMQALNIIISQYSDNPMPVADNKAKATCVFKVEIQEMSFKQNTD